MALSTISNPDHNQVGSRFLRSRQPSGNIIFVEDFRSPANSFWNDGVGSCSRDCDVTFAGLPSLRLDNQGNMSGGITNPGRTAVTSGVVAKRRIHDGYSGRFGVEMWFRFTSTNLTSSSYLSMSLYNRDGTNAYHSRVWLWPNGNNQPMQALILDGAASFSLSGTNGAGAGVYTLASTSVLQYAAGTHMYDPANGRLDRAGGWHYAKMVTDMQAKKYVSLQIDGQSPVDLSTYNMDTTATTGFGGMHFSVEFASSTSTVPKYVNVAQVVGTAE